MKNPVGKIFTLFAGLILAALLMSCARGPVSGSSGPVIKLVVNPWTSSELNATIAKIILEEKMGYPTELVAMDEYAMWESLSQGEVHAALEVWPSGHQDHLQMYVEEQKSVENGGPLGPVGKINWYIPSYLLRDHPELATWQGFQKPENAALFAASGTGSKGRFLLGDATWTSNDGEIIQKLGLNLEVTVVGSEEAVLTELGTAYKDHRPILFYFWTPHWAHVLYDLSPVALPADSAGCSVRDGAQACEYPSEEMLKVYWAGFKAYAPDAHAFLSRFTYKNVDQITLLAIVELDGKNVEETARLWVDEQESVWGDWVPER